MYACLIEQHKSVSFLCKHNKNLFILLILLCTVEIRMMVENAQINEVNAVFLVDTFNCNYCFDRF